MQCKYQIEPENAILIAWGDNMDKVVDDYVKQGGTCVFIQGETEMTFPNDYFEDKVDWHCTFTQVPSSVGSRPEQLSVNTRY